MIVSSAVRGFDHAYCDVVDNWDEPIRTLFSFEISRVFKALNKLFLRCFSVLCRSGVDT